MAGRRSTFKPIAGATILVFVFLLGITAGCSSDKGNPYGPGGGGGTPGANEVWAQNMAFSPASRTVTVGTTVTWTNKDAAVHTVTGTGWGSGNLSQGQTFAHTFTAAGSYSYHCTIHPSMTGTVSVTAQ